MKCHADTGSSSKIHPRTIIVGKCSCPCWGKVVALSRLVKDLYMEIEKHNQVIGELQDITRVFVEGKEEKEDIPHTLPTQLTPSETEELDKQKDEGEFDIHKTCEVTEVEVEPELTQLTVDTLWMEKEPEEIEVTPMLSPCWPKIIKTEGSVTIPVCSNESVNNFTTDANLLESLICNTEPTSDAGITGNAVAVSASSVKKRIKRQNNENSEGSRPKGSKSSTKDISLVCSLCTKGHIFRNRALLRRHIRHFHTGPPKYYGCKQCDRVFQYKEGLTYHMQSVHQGIRYLCGELGCKSAYSTITALRKHKRLTEHNSSSHQIISLMDKYPKSKYQSEPEEPPFVNM